MFDRSFSTARTSRERDDVAGETARDCCASNGDFLGDELLPLYVEVENEENDDDGIDDHHDWLIEQPTARTI